MHLPTTTPPDLTPTRAHHGDAGLDLRSAVDVTIPIGQRRTITTGIAIAIPTGHVGLIAARSGLGFRHGITLTNSVGIIDAGYRGPVHVSLINHGDEPYRIRRGDRIAQLIVLPVALPAVKVVEVLPPSDDGRDGGGLGSTGTA